MSAPTAKQRAKALEILEELVLDGDDQDIEFVAQALADEREAALDEAARACEDRGLVLVAKEPFVVKDCAASIRALKGGASHAE